MSTTTTRHAYRRTGRRVVVADPGTGAPFTCDCGVSGHGDELISHECANDIRHALRATRPTDIATNPGDSLDVPEWRGGAAGHTPRRSAGPVEIVNRYPGTCAACHTPVAAGAGKARKDAAGKWMTLCLRDAAETDATPAPQPAAEAPPCRTNRYAGPCRFCGGNVPAGEGFLCRVDGAWAVEHGAGACNASSGHTAAPQANVAPAADVPAGHYAIASTGDNDLAFYRVDHVTEGTYAGRTFVKLIVGGHPDRNVPRSHVAGILERIAADGPAEAAARYGVEIGRCCVCNRHLTDEASRAAGIGPECATKGRF